MSSRRASLEERYAHLGGILGAVAGLSASGTVAWGMVASGGPGAPWFGLATVVTGTSLAWLLGREFGGTVGWGHDSSQRLREVTGTGDEGREGE